MAELVYESPLGPLLLMARGGKLIYCNWESSDCEVKKRRVLKFGAALGGDPALSNEKILELAVGQLNEYFEGDREDFDLPVEPYGTPFQKRVWEAMARIRYGEVRAYSWISKEIGAGRGHRAVAQACGGNPLAIILPCHRVVATDGGSGGYTGGIEKKEWLLKWEKSNLSKK